MTLDDKVHFTPLLLLSQEELGKKLLTETYNSGCDVIKAIKAIRAIRAIKPSTRSESSERSELSDPLELSE